MRILQIIGGLGTGGAEKLLVEIIPMLAAQGHTVDLLLLNGAITPFYKQLEASRTCNIYVLGHSFYSPIHIFKMMRYLQKYDLVHVHLFPAQYFAVIASILSFSKIPMVFTEHSTGNTRMDNPLFRTLERLIYPHYRAIICITDSVKAALMCKLGLAEKRLHVIENGIDLVSIKKIPAADRSSLGYSKYDILLIMVAGFREQKDQDTVIKAMKRLPENYKLLLVGDGKRRPELEQLIRELSLQDKVSLLGVRTDTYALLKMSNISIMSSHWEGFGLAAVEAMACGVPVIASDVPGLSQVVSQGGLLFEKGNISDLLDKIILLENQDIYHSIKYSGIKKSKDYSIEVMVDQIVDLYQKLV
ncbi:glycosyltransferase [Sphingobacterium multivorum]|uniref:glycosyltransferase n=1 Tax=Sphingobacterium multivorum TaxID=28454 RepID=UPI003DA35BD5